MLEVNYISEGRVMLRTQIAVDDERKLDIYESGVHRFVTIVVKGSNNRGHTRAMDPLASDTKKRSQSLRLLVLGPTSANTLLDII